MGEAGLYLVEIEGIRFLQRLERCFVRRIKAENRYGPIVLPQANICHSRLVHKRDEHGRLGLTLLKGEVAKHFPVHSVPQGKSLQVPRVHAEIRRSWKLRTIIVKTLMNGYVFIYFDGICLCILWPE